jgi:hypothetical protein
MNETRLKQEKAYEDLRTSGQKEGIATKKITGAEVLDITLASSVAGTTGGAIATAKALKDNT